MTRYLAGILVLGGLSSFAAAADLDLTYIESSLGGGQYSYAMTLSVDTTDGSGAWTSGMGWGWITFGDVASGVSPLNNFVLTSSVPAPFGYLSSSGGSHNGPSWIFDGTNNLVNWVPTSATDTLTWTGTSSYDASTQGTLYFSEIISQGGATEDNFKPMVAATPEPASIALMGAGLLGLIRRRRK